MKTPFCGATYQSRSTNVACDRCINFFPELNSQNDKGLLVLFGTPGVSIFSTALSNTIRGMHVFNGLIYIVAGANLYSVNTSGVASAALGTLNTASGRVSMSDNGLASAGVGGNQLAIADGSNLYTYNVLTTTFAIQSPTTPSFVTYIDGYFVVNKVGSMSVFASNLYDGTTWNGLATAQISAAPDLVQCVINLQQQLWFIKEYSTEVWYDAGVATSTGFPFARVSGSVIDYGTSAPWTVARGDNSLFWLANQRTGDIGECIGVVELSGYVPTVVTPPQILYQWQTYPTLTDAFGYCYTMAGHTFYVITFPSGNATWVYDATYKLWHEWSTYVPGVAYSVNRHISNCHAYYNGGHYVGDWQNGNIYLLSPVNYTDNGNPIVSVRIAPHFFDPNELKNLFIHKMTVDAETGVGDLVGAYQNPQATLAWSDDGAHTWSNEYMSSLGRVGTYKTRLIWRRLGYSRDRVFKLTMADPVKKVVVGGYIE